MGEAHNHISEMASANRNGIHIVFPGDNLAVRKALRSVLDGLKHLELPGEVLSVVEIVVAECLNNVVEHAYADDTQGMIEINARLRENALWFRIVDDGFPMPAETLPDGHPHDLDAMQDDLPEGGFGWFLIKQLTNDLQYVRDEDQNRLTFSISTLEHKPH